MGVMVLIVVPQPWMHPISLVDKIFNPSNIDWGLVQSIMNNNVKEMRCYDCNAITFVIFYLFTIQLYMILILIQEKISQYALGQSCHGG